MIPSRFVNANAARRRYGARVDRLTPLFFAKDPPADEFVEYAATQPPGHGWTLFERALESGIDAIEDAPESLWRLFVCFDSVPVWVAWPRIARGGSLFGRSGQLGQLVLGLRSLLYGYASPAGNKPLIVSGQLRDNATARLHGTSQFVRAVCSKDGLRRFSDGFKTTARVRLVHANVRRQALTSGSWHTEHWGEPINQHDMVSTIILFSFVFIDGLSKLGLLFSPSEREDYIHLWRYVGYLLGVDEVLLPTSWSQSAETGELIRMTQAPPDDDARLLTRALIDSMVAGTKSPLAAWRMRKIISVFSFELLGRQMANELGISPSRLQSGVPTLRSLITMAETIRWASREWNR